LSLTSPLDVALLIAAAGLGVQLRRSRPPLWELAVCIALAVATVKASRSGVWLVFFLAVPAARGLRSPRWWDWIMPPVATLALVGLVVGVVRGPLASGPSSRLLARAILLANGTPIVADDIIGEQVALAGGRIWVGNPIDAFSKQDQSTYLDWLQGSASGRAALGPEVRVVVTSKNTAAQRLMARDSAFKNVARDSESELYKRVASH
jgi:hypothetical protein